MIARVLSSPANRRRLAVVGSIAAAFALALSTSWFRWSSSIIDVGEELYVPWQLVEGRALYEDIAFARGFLSPYFNAATFLVLGPEYDSLVAVNLALTAVLCYLVFALLRPCGRWAATIASCVFVTMFAFASTNYNYVTPYSHEQVHVHLLAFAGFLWLRRGLRRGGRWLSLGPGLIGGLLFFTKVELFLCYSAASGAALLWWSVLARSGRRRTAVHLAVFAGALVLPCLIVMGIQQVASPVPLDRHAALQAWVQLWRFGRGHIEGNISRLGFDDIGGNATVMVVQTIAVCVGGALALLANHVLRPWGRSPWVLAALFISAAYIIHMRVPPMWMQSCFRSLPLLALAYVVVVGRETRGARADRASLASSIPLVAFGLFALLMLGRMLLRAELLHYGFSMAMPAMIVAIELVRRVGGALARRSSGRADVFLALALGVLVGVVSVQMLFSDVLYEQQKTWIGPGRPRGTFRTADLGERRGRMLGDALTWLRTKTKDQDSVVVVPEGVMLNFLAKRRNPTRYTVFNPPTFNQEGDDRVRAALRAASPDYVVMVDRDNSEHGARYFGRDFAQRTAAWIESAYVEVRAFGKRPFQGDGFGIRIMRRKR